jgi:hypothetical protein
LKAFAISSSIGVIVAGVLGGIGIGELTQGVNQVLSGAEKTTATNDNLEEIQEKIERKCELHIRTAPEENSPDRTQDLYIKRIEEITPEAVTEDGSFSRTNITYNLLSSQQTRTTKCRIQGDINFNQETEHRVEVSCADCEADPPDLKISKDSGGE